MTTFRWFVYCGLGIVVLSLGTILLAEPPPGKQPPIAAAATNTPEPTYTPGLGLTLTPTATPVPVTYNFQGTASTTTGPMQLHSGPMIMAMEFGGRGNFVVHLLNSEGRIAEYALANAIGRYSGQKVFAVSRDDVYFFDVLADGPWVIIAQQLTAPR